MISVAPGWRLIIGEVLCGTPLDENHRLAHPGGRVHHRASEVKTDETQGSDRPDGHS